MIKSVSYFIVVLPKDVLRWLRTILNDTSQVDMAANVDVKFGSAQNDSFGNCNRIIDT